MSKKKIVYIVLEVIDLGDHIVSVHYSEQIAQQVVEKLNREYAETYKVVRESFYYTAERVQA